ncbi:MAG: hypothetical protein D6753_04350 [Planctomycetota bacterium]|nr:MAG: hypothetical protein D6753_04350 [Planctomycetota bacterium]
MMNPPGMQRQDPTVDLQRNLMHDLKSPLATIVQICRAHLGSPPHGPDGASHLVEALQCVLTQAELALGWCESVVDGSRLVPLRDRFDSSMVLSRLQPALEVWARHHGVRLVVDAAAWSPVPLYTDLGMLERVLFNLVNNAIQQSSPGTTVRLAVEHLRRQPAVRFSVIDSAGGLPPDVLQLWQSSSMSSDSNSRQHRVGRGATIVRHLVDLLGVELTVQSDAQQTQVDVTVPVDHLPALLDQWSRQLWRGSTSAGAHASDLVTMAVYVVRCRHASGDWINRQLQQRARPEDFVYRVAADRWMWFAVDRREEECPQVWRALEAVQLRSPTAGLLAHLLWRSAEFGWADPLARHFRLSLAIHQALPKVHQALATVHPHTVAGSARADAIWGAGMRRADGEAEVAREPHLRPRIPTGTALPPASIPHAHPPAGSSHPPRQQALPSLRIDRALVQLAHHWHAHHAQRGTDAH